MPHSPSPPLRQPHPPTAARPPWRALDTDIRTPESGPDHDESLVADPPTYTTDTKAVFVHHTAGTNDYTWGILHTAAGADFPLVETGDRGSEHLLNHPTLYAKALVIDLNRRPATPIRASPSADVGDS
ncbi:hypothetical protein [Streptomyces scopuliridis]|uniref:hypothetical protein n=1 Tax=Streptomyces scopuliridis TaxID=452529 RepID=UPI00368FB0F4